MARPVRIVHIIYRLDFGGMENGLVNLINRLPAERFSHVILCLTHATDFKNRIRRGDVPIIECHKPAGKHPPTYWRVYRELRRLSPDIVHTRNLGTLDMAWLARLAGCPMRIHGEHGWSADDPTGASKKYRLLRRLCDPAVHRYVAVSRDIRNWLVDVIGIADAKVETLHNGVDMSRFHDDGKRDEDRESGRVVFGTLGRHEPIKGLEVFLAAVRDLLQERPEWRQRIRVIMAGDGPTHQKCEELRDGYGLQEIIELPGTVEDVPTLLGQFDFFVQPSLNEGISNTVLEAMASGLPVIATSVGGNPELVREDREGRLIPPNDSSALTAAILAYLDDPVLRQRHRQGGRERVRQFFSINKMTDNYERLYEQSCSEVRSEAV